MQDLKETLSGLIQMLFPGTEWRFDYSATFPFTNPSIEVEVKFNGAWVEILGGGVIHQNIMSAHGLEITQGWAFGLGLDRLDMMLFF